MNIKKSVNYYKDPFRRYSALENYKITLAQLLKHIPVEHRKSYIDYTSISEKVKSNKKINKINVKGDIDDQFAFSLTSEGYQFWHDIYVDAVRSYLKTISE